MAAISPALVVSLPNDPIMFLMLINVLLLVVGCFLNASAAIFILTPIVITLGIDRIFPGVLIVGQLNITYFPALTMWLPTALK